MEEVGGRGTVGLEKRVCRGTMVLSENPKYSIGPLERATLGEQKDESSKQWKNCSIAYTKDFRLHSMGNYISFHGQWELLKASEWKLKWKQA